jgi:thermitase
MKKRSLMVVGILVVLLFSASFALAKEAWAPDPPNRYVPGEVIVGFSPNATLAQINAAVSSIGGTIKAKFNVPKGRIVRVKLPSIDPSAVGDAMNSLKSNPAFANVISYVEPNIIRKAHGAWDPGVGAGVLSQSGDPLLYNQWGYYDIGANWINAPTTTTGVTVAVIDTGVDYTHPDLVGKVIKGYDYVNVDNDPMDDYGHGTHVSGIIAAKANNNYGITGVSPNSKILAIKALDSSGYGNDYDISLAIIAAANNASVKVINMSLGGSYSSTEDLAVYYAVVTKRKLLVASAGNSNTSTPDYPAGLSAYSSYYPGGYTNMVLAVAAHDSTDCRASFSNYGTWVNTTAPGVNILSTIPPYLDSTNSGFAYWDGTSMAAPHVAGAAALAWQKYPTYTNVQIASLITTLNASPYTTLNRDGSCWPSDGSTFERLYVMHILEQQFFEACNNKGGIEGYAFDAETGLPLVGAKVTVKQGTTTTGVDYVPDYGEYTNPLFSSFISRGYGLFNVLATSGDSKLTITKPKYISFSPKDQSGLPVLITVPTCAGTNAGNIPVPPLKPTYWFVVTWDYGYTGSYELGAAVYQYGTPLGTIYYGLVGELYDYPYIKLLWDDYSYWYDYFNFGIEDLRAFSETIRIRKLIPGGDYLFYVWDWWNGVGSTSWASTGIKAYLYKGNSTTGYKLVKTYTPPAGAGQYWVICDIYGNTINNQQYLQD